jgi:hypothetical protein
MVGDVTFVPESRQRDIPNYAIALKPIAVLAGVLDPGGVSTPLKAHAHIGSYGTNNREPPRKDAMAIIVLQIVTPDSPGDGGEPQKKPAPSDSYFIVSDICTFMPDPRGSICEVTGLNDRRVIETIEKLRDARRKSVPDPHGAASGSATTTKGTN